MLEWKQQDNLWIASMPEGGRYEVSQKQIYDCDKHAFVDGWKCSMICRCTSGRMGLAAMIETLTFEQAKGIAARHWGTGVWAPPKGK